jgi:ABC-2 type transport system ATP-binding protein
MSAWVRDRFHQPREPSGPNGIEVAGLAKSLGGRPILFDVDLVVPRASVAVLQGANGTGKTTLIRMLATVVTPDAGSVFVNGFDAVGDALQVRRSVGVSFANERSLYWRITGLQNLELFGRIAGLTTSAIVERSADLLDVLCIGEAARGQVARMSTGQRQRLMIVRAMLANPSVVLLDEPFRGLDDEGLAAFMEVVVDRTRSGMTALIAAPLIEAVVPIADACYRIEGHTLVPFLPGESA